MDATWISRRISTAPHLSDPTVRWRTLDRQAATGRAEPEDR
jgi:hypothetical protein